MRKTIFAIALILCAGCNRIPQGEGSIALSLQPQEMVADVARSNVADYAALPSAADFNLTLTNYAGAVAWTGKFADWDPTAKFSAGEYEIKASYGNPDEEGVAKPCFEGLKEFVVIAYESVNVNVEPRLSNCIIKVTTGEYFKQVFTASSFSVTTGLGNKFALAVGSGLFIDAFKFTLEGNFTTAGGKNVLFSKEFTGLEAATLYTANIEVNNVEGTAFTITFNNETETVYLEEELN